VRSIIRTFVFDRSRNTVVEVEPLPDYSYPLAPVYGLNGGPHIVTESEWTRLRAAERTK
jgi:hypothetical protein